jgi:hypothetical protein
MVVGQNILFHPERILALLSARVAENARICDQRDLLRGFRSLRG